MEVDILVAIPRVGMPWTPDGKRKRERAKETWETISWTGDVGERVEMGRGGKTSEGQATMGFFGMP